MENTDGKRDMWWARNQIAEDYQLLCRDGTRTDVRGFERCGADGTNTSRSIRRNSYTRVFKVDFILLCRLELQKLIAFAFQISNFDTSNPERNM